VIGHAPAGARLVAVARWVLLGALIGATALAFRAPARPPVSYQCPMHPEVRSASPGTCPLCRMALQPVRPGRLRGPGLVLSPTELVLGGVQLTRPVPGPAGSWWVPIHALVVEPSGAAHLFVVGPDGRSFSRRPVEPVKVDGARAAVLGEGLDAPVRVVAAGAQLVDLAASELGTSP
jgi:hypothetical protein